MKEMLKDARAEKEMVEQELAKLLAVSLSGRSAAEHEKEVSGLKQRITELQKESEQVLSREKSLLAKIQELDGTLVIQQG